MRITRAAVEAKWKENSVEVEGEECLRTQTRPSKAIVWNVLK